MGLPGERLDGRERWDSGGGGERPLDSGAEDQIWSREPPLGLKHLFWKTQPSQVQDRAGRRGWDRRSNDPYHPLSGPVSTRMPMRTSQRRRARSAAPQCDPCLPVSMPNPLPLCTGIGRKGPAFSNLHVCPTLLPRSMLRLCPGWGSAVALRF